MELPTFEEYFKIKEKCVLLFNQMLNLFLDISDSLSLCNHLNALLFKHERLQFTFKLG